MRTCCITCAHIVEGTDGKAVCDTGNNLKVRSAVCKDSKPSGLPLRFHLCTCCMRLLLMLPGMQQDDLGAGKTGSKETEEDTHRSGGSRTVLSAASGGV